ASRHRQEPSMNFNHWIICALVLLVGLLCSAPASAAACYANTYHGKTGGLRIQNAVNDTNCSTIYVNPNGPDRGNWNLEKPITLSRSNVIVRSTSESLLPVLLATGNDWVNYNGMIIIDGQFDILLHRLNLQGGKKSYSGVWLRHSRRITIDSGVIA